MTQSPIPFTKMHGIGNDFVVLDHWKQAPGFELTLKLAQKLGDRKFGVGCDQILWLKPPKDSANHARMEIRNADGSEASMCGNGIRAIAHYLVESGPVVLRGRDQYLIETLAGVQKISVLQGPLYRVELGVPKFIKSEMISGSEWSLIDVGNLHAVTFVDQVTKLDLNQAGPVIENSKAWPKPVNVEWVQRLSSQHLKMRVWETGAGETLACGSGACAVGVAHLRSLLSQSKTQKFDSPQVVDVDLPGGSLQIEWGGEGTPVVMTGTATRVFDGVFDLG